ncbi:hypothetical protein ACI2LO_04675 [Streptomyces sp. NPDC033754]|uniref:hypothetical protein n=1 Tax=unclassified Streptomyces TaxID=2593676 RepID=UPI0034038E27
MAAAGFFSAIMPYVRGWVKVAFEAFRAYAFYLFYVARSAMAKRNTCVKIFAYVVTVPFLHATAPTAWHRRC